MFPIDVLRIALGLLISFFAPGYAITLALFPKKGDLDAIERITLSFAFSVALVPLVIFFLNKYLGVGTFPIDATHSALASIAIIALSVLIWAIRKGRSPQKQASAQ